jgi:hypothetical protein
VMPSSPIKLRGRAERQHRYKTGVRPSDAAVPIPSPDKIEVVTSTVQVLVLDLLEWLCRKDRSYEETMDAWRTSCPKLPVWEDANDCGLVCIDNSHGRSSVRVTPAGFEYLKKFRPEATL